MSEHAQKQDEELKKHGDPLEGVVESGSTPQRPADKQAPDEGTKEKE